VAGRADTLADALLALMERLRSEIRVALPGRVTTVNHAAGTVGVRVESLVPRPLRDGGHALDELPELLDVPVRQLVTATASVQAEVTVGDTGVVLFTDVALGAWLQAGQTVAPPSVVLHGPSGAVFAPGLLADGGHPGLLQGGVRAVVEARGGARVEVSDAEVRVYDAGTAEPLALRSDVQGVIDAITNGVPVPQDGGAALQTSIVAGLAGLPLGTSVLKGE